MSPRFKREYMETIYLQYKKASRRAEKSALITELCLTCGWRRKPAIRAIKNFKRFTKPKPKRRGKPSVYNIPSVIGSAQAALAYRRTTLLKTTEADHPSMVAVLCSGVRRVAFERS